MEERGVVDSSFGGTLAITVPQASSFALSLLCPIQGMGGADADTRPGNCVAPGDLGPALVVSTAGKSLSFLYFMCR